MRDLIYTHSSQAPSENYFREAAYQWMLPLPLKYMR